MAAPSWPSTLQQYFNEVGFAYNAGESVLRTELQVGFAESRNLFSDAVWTAQGSITIPYNLFDTFVNFYEETLKNGSLRFWKVDPLDGWFIWLWRFAEPFVVSAYGGEKLVITFALERVPGTKLNQTLLNNGDFFKDLNHWNHNASHYRWAAPGVCEKYGTGSEQHITQTVTTVIGKKYYVVFDCLEKTLDPIVSIDGIYSDLTQFTYYNDIIYDSGSGKASFGVGRAVLHFVAKSTTHSFGVAGNNALFKIDKFWVGEFA